MPNRLNLLTKPQSIEGRFKLFLAVTTDGCCNNFSLHQILHGRQKSEHALYKKDLTLFGIFKRHKPVQKCLELSGLETEVAVICLYRVDTIVRTRPRETINLGRKTQRDRFYSMRFKRKENLVYKIEIPALRVSINQICHVTILMQKKRWEKPSYHQYPQKVYLFEKHFETLK